MQREFLLDPQDTAYLDGKWYEWETLEDGMWVIIHNFPICEGYNTRVAKIAVQILSTDYLRMGLDMAYFLPALGRLDGVPIPCIETNMLIQGQQFQRWSRHRLDSPWIIGSDSLATHLNWVEFWLSREFSKGVITV